MTISLLLSYKSDKLNLGTVTANKTPPRQLSWMRTREKLPTDSSVHQCVLAYLSDYTILNTASKHHGISYFQENVHMVSLDHSMWFHNEFVADEWLLYVQDSPSASGSRAFTRPNLRSFWRSCGLGIPRGPYAQDQQISLSLQ